MNKLTHRALSFCLSCLSIMYLGHGQGYKIDVSIEGLDKADLFLGYYFAGKTYVKDTATLTTQNGYSFSGSEPLNKGMYFLAQNGKLLFDLVVGEDQVFRLNTTSKDLLNAMVVEGDVDNQLFFDNMRFNKQRNEEAAPFLAVLRDSTSTAIAKTEARKRFAAIDRKVEDHMQEIMDQYPNSVLAAMMGVNKKLEIPEEVAETMDMDNQAARFAYLLKHYWDGIDLGNSILLRLSSPVYKQKVDHFMDNMIHPTADSIKKASDQLINVAKKDKDTYQYLTWHLTLKYQTSKIMGMDEVYVHLVDTYFMTGEMDYWANEQLKKNLKEKADQYRNSLIGMVAPNLILQDLNKKPQALHDLSNNYSVIYFYDPDCGHCKKETPVLKAFHDTTSFDVGIFTVSADTSMAKMKGYIEEMGLKSWTNTNGTRTYGINYQEVYDAYTTPTIYLLNEKKEIIAKKIAASQLSEVLSNYEKRSR